MSQLLSSTIPGREFEYHTDGIHSVVVLPDKRRMVTGSCDKTLCLWDLRTGIVLKKMEGHCDRVWTLALSRDGELIASGDESGELFTWYGETGESLIPAIKAHFDSILSLDFSPDGTVLASGSLDGTTKFWSTKTMQLQGNPICDDHGVRCVRYSPSGELLAIATHGDIEIYCSDTKERVANFKGRTQWNSSLAWIPNGTRLLSGGHGHDPTIREWDTSTWQQVGDPWTGHTHDINAIAIHPAGTLAASASEDGSVRLWQLSDRLTIAIFQHSTPMIRCVTFSVDGNHILSGGFDKLISEWVVPEDASPDKALKKLASKIQVSEAKILTMNPTARNACVMGDLSTAEALFTQEINTNTNNHTSYANRSSVMARKDDWDHALHDANKSVTIQPSLTGYISKGIALCGKGQVQDSSKAFDLAFIFANEDSETIHFLLLIKAIAIFNADQHREAVTRVQELATACPNHDTLACRVVEAYLRVQLGINAMDESRYNEAVDHFTVAVDNIPFPSTISANHSKYEDLVVLFGWDLKSLWRHARQKWCDALLRSDKIEEALKSYQFTMDLSDESTMTSLLGWSNAFKQECSMLYLAKGDGALAAGDYDRAIGLYTVAIGLNSTSDVLFTNRCKARLEIMFWDDALLDAHKVVELNPSSHVGYQLKHTALFGAQQYDDAIAAFEVMLLKLDNTPDAQIRKLRQQYVTRSKAEGIIRRAIDIQLDSAPLRLLYTLTGLLCDREAQRNTFQTSTEYKELVLSTMKHPNLQAHITEVVATYFRCVMLSHRWDGKEPLLRDIQDKIVFELNPLGGIVKLQKFCEIARDAGFHWAWSDTCCIDKNITLELQESLNSMFTWYHHSALTIVYLADVPPSSKSGALAKSEWNRRGWTFQEFVAPKVVLFYQADWTLYLDDHSPNHKQSAAIMEELESATGIDRQALIVFHPGMNAIRERLQWASTRKTTVQEDIAYSLFGIFGVRLLVNYGEKKQHALARLLQEIVARSGDITALDWVGQSSEFNSCLPADIVSYANPPCALSSLSEDEVQTMVSSLRDTVAAGSASKLYTLLDNISPPRFAQFRLHLPCFAFRVTEVRRKRDPAQETHDMYGVKADGLHDLQIITDETLIEFSRTRPTQKTFLLVRPWDRRLLELHDFADDAESLGDLSEPESPLDDSSAELELDNLKLSEQALRLLVRLGQPFGAFLLAQHRGREYKRIASDHDIIAQVKDIASVHNWMGVRTLEIL